MYRTGSVLGPAGGPGRRLVGASAGVALRARLALTDPALRAASARIWRPAGLDARFPAYLAAMHGVIRASVPLMERAAERCAGLGPGDPVAGPLIRYLRQHIEEERGHDDWLLADLAALGTDPAAVLAGQPSASVAALAGAQYYWIEHHHPVALLGYIAVLESCAPAPWLAERIAATSAVPPAALRTLREHAGLDGGHARAVFDLLDELPPAAALVDAVALSGLHTVRGLIDLFTRIDRAPGRPGPLGGTSTP
ncbi:iron-containing redox enzyme family protein [Actinacidiphila acididurans]|uniref:Iron-containing redox enzyme family protein n=1 Tax=Actinacidiphila acididurans TaxID=2784346 RepID=A0ABS2TZW2_9ACTN|nr:iron-containing redox enzyme family protein [Actinacidiphila acididurans]MBM9508888.1 iron-containing redox enzyme family protein [Actinacidiphila acididurans]